MAVVSGGPSAAKARGGRTRLAAPASKAVIKRRRRVCIIVTEVLLSGPQLAFDLGKEAPIGILSDDLLRARLEQAGFVQPQRVEAKRILGVVVPPFVEGSSLRA
jgi:hypothetical protein